MQQIPQQMQQQIPQQMQQQMPQQFMSQQPRRFVKPKQEQTPNYNIVNFVLMLVYYFDSSDKCRTDAGGKLDKKSFIYNGLWTFSSVAIIMLILNNTVLKMFNQVFGGGLIDSIFKGFILYFVYNFYIWICNDFFLFVLVFWVDNILFHCKTLYIINIFN